MTRRVDRVVHLTDAQWMARMFPSDRARRVADEALDDLPVSEPMSTFLDAWLAAYRRAGGTTPMGNL